MPSSSNLQASEIHKVSIIDLHMQNHVDMQ